MAKLRKIEQMVFCPYEWDYIPLEQCKCCEDFKGIVKMSEDDEQVFCEFDGGKSKFEEGDSR